MEENLRRRARRRASRIETFIRASEYTRRTNEFCLVSRMTEGIKQPTISVSNPSYTSMPLFRIHPILPRISSICGSNPHLLPTDLPPDHS